MNPQCDPCSRDVAFLTGSELHVNHKKNVASIAWQIPQGRVVVKTHNKRFFVANKFLKTKEFVGELFAI